LTPIANLFFLKEALMMTISQKRVKVMFMAPRTNITLTRKSILRIHIKSIELMKFPTSTSRSFIPGWLTSC
jgi:hypothetical protein